MSQPHLANFFAKKAVYYDAAAANHLEASGFPRFTEKRWNPGEKS